MHIFTHMTYLCLKHAAHPATPVLQHLHNCLTPVNQHTNCAFQVSRAMRNRGIELCLLPPSPPSLPINHNSTASQDVLAAVCPPTAVQAIEEAAGSDMAASADALGGLQLFVVCLSCHCFVIFYCSLKVESAAAMCSQCSSMCMHLNIRSRFHTHTHTTLTGTAATARQAQQQGAASVLAAEGMASGGPCCVSAMAQTHVAVCALAVAAHRKPPGLGALSGWARLARVLAQRGWGAEEALTEAWHLVRCFLAVCVFDCIGIQGFSASSVHMHTMWTLKLHSFTNNTRTQHTHAGLLRQLGARTPPAGHCQRPTCLNAHHNGSTHTLYHPHTH